MQQYGLIGFPLSHSFSQKYFTEKFFSEGIHNAEFFNFSIPDIKDVEQIFNQHPQLKGLAVTIPYKKSVIAYCDEVSEVVRAIAACNCIKISANKKYGFNTDVTGFEKSFIKKLRPHHKKALILGTGGAAAAVKFVLHKLGIEYIVVSRQVSNASVLYDNIDDEVLNDYKIIINCTPLGTYPKTNEAPALPYHLLNSSHYLFDLVYNPPLTKFLQYGKNKGCSIENGYEMLAIQAEENWKIWNG